MEKLNLPPRKESGETVVVEGKILKTKRMETGFSVRGIRKGRGAPPCRVYESFPGLILPVCPWFFHKYPVRLDLPPSPPLQRHDYCSPGVWANGRDSGAL